MLPAKDTSPLIYDFVCPQCGDVQEDSASMNSFKEHKPPCKKCGTPSDYKWTPTVTQFVLKDGPTGSFPSKGNRIKAQMTKRSEAAAKRQKDRYPAREIVPNYDGKDTGTWKEAQYEAVRDQGTEAAASYVPRIEKEKTQGIK